MCDRFAAADDRVVLAPVFNTIEQLSEVASGVGRGDFGHAIRLSDLLSDGKSGLESGADTHKLAMAVPVRKRAGRRTCARGHGLRGFGPVPEAQITQRPSVCALSRHCP